MTFFSNHRGTVGVIVIQKESRSKTRGIDQLGMQNQVVRGLKMWNLLIQKQI